MNNINRNSALVSLLKVSAVCIAIPRAMALSVAMFGVVAAESYPWLITVELLSGFGLAALEGVAIAFIFSKWKQAKQDRILLYFIATLITTWPLAFAPSMVAEQNGITVSELTTLVAGTGLLSIMLQLAHSGLVATLPMLIVAGVGYADSVVEVSKGIVEVKQDKQEFPCPTCDKQFSTKQGLGGHTRHCKGIAVDLVDLVEVKRE